MKMADGGSIPPTNKTFKVDFCTVAHWNENGEIVEENLFMILWACSSKLEFCPARNKKKPHKGDALSQIRRVQSGNQGMPLHLPPESRVLSVPSIHAKPAVLVARAAD